MTGMDRPDAARIPPEYRPQAERSLGRSRWVHVLVSGPSMVPTLKHGDHVLVRRTTRIRPGHVVVGSFPARPDLLVVKRAVRRSGGGWWLVSDNEAVADDSRRYGPAAVYGRAVVRWWPPRRLGLLRARILSRTDLVDTE